MPANSKPRKSMQQRSVKVPMMATTRDGLAIQMHTTLETLINRPDVDSFNRLFRIILAVETASPTPELVGMSDALNDVSERFVRIGKIGVNAQESEKLKQGSAIIDGKLPTIPQNVLKEAIRQVNRMWK